MRLYAINHKIPIMKTFRKSIHAILTLIITFTNFSALSAQNCGDCPKRHVILYDLDIQVPRPGDPVKILQWQQLFRAAFIVADVAVNDPTGGCLNFFDGTLVDREGHISDTVVFGLTHTNIAPQGEVSGSDYLISGAITGNEGAYTMTVNLETACSREIVTSGSTNFSSAGQAPDIAHTLALQVFSQVASTIEQFEINKRNADTEVARDVQDGQLVLKPSKRMASRAETVPVQITLVDCDGTPLANRIIRLQDPRNESENGAFSTQTVKTDANGIANASFLTGLMPGMAIVRVMYAYTYPWGCENVAGTSATILIGDPVPDGYVIETKLSYLKTSTYKYSGEMPNPICSYYAAGRQTSILKKELTMTAICENTGGQDAEGVIELVSSSIAVQGYKDDRDETNSYQAGQCTGMPFGEAIGYDLWLRSGPVISGFDDDGYPLSWVAFRYNPNDPGTLLFELTMSGSIMERIRENQWSFATPLNPGDKAFFSINSDTTEFSYAAISESVSPDVGGSIKIVGSGFEIDLEQDESTEGPGDAGGQSHLQVGEILSIHATVMPLSEYLKLK